MRTLISDTSTPETVCPMRARHAPVTQPTYPRPKTAMRITILQVRTDIALTSVIGFLCGLGLYSTRARNVKDRTFGVRELDLQGTHVASDSHNRQLPPISGDNCLVL